MEERDQAYVKRIEQRQGTSNWLNLWPIFLAPVIPLIGLTVKNPRVRNAAIAVVGGTVVVGAHSVAMSTSTFTK